MINGIKSELKNDREFNDSSSNGHDLPPR